MKDPKPEYVLRITGSVRGRPIPLSYNFYWCGKAASTLFSTRYHNAIRYVSLEVAQIAARELLDTIKETYPGIDDLGLLPGKYQESTGNEWADL